MVKVGSLEVVGKIDNSQIMLEMDKLRRATRSTRAEVNVFQRSFNALAAAGGAASAAVAGLVSLANVGPRTQIAMEKLNTIFTAVGLELDKRIGPALQMVVDMLGSIDSSTLAMGALGGAGGGILGAGLGFLAGGPLGALVGGVIGSGIGGLLAMLLEQISKSNVLDKNDVIRENVENSIDYTPGTTYGQTKKEGPQGPDITWNATAPTEFYTSNITINGTGFSWNPGFNLWTGE